MCRDWGQPTVSKLLTPTIGADTVFGPDSRSACQVIIHFHPPGDTTCYGDEVSATRHFHLPEDPDYDVMTAAIGAGQDIEIEAKISASGLHFSRVDWQGV